MSVTAEDVHRQRVGRPRGGGFFHRRAVQRTAHGYEPLHAPNGYGFHFRGAVRLMVVRAMMKQVVERSSASSGPDGGRRWQPSSICFLRLVPLLLCTSLGMLAVSVANSSTDAGESHITTAGESGGSQGEHTFSRFKDRIVKIEVLEKSSNTKHALGTAFFVGNEGHLLTNYHVVSDAVAQPDHYGLRLDVGVQWFDATIVALDVIHDLAIVRAEGHRREGFSLEGQEPKKGATLYSLGHPHDLGLTIAQGTYNGPLENRLYDQLHFTGAINAGMSGGPTLTSDGVVVGVNVASMGNQVGFLVPVDRARELYQRLRRDGATPATQLRHSVLQQLLRHDEDVFSRSEVENAERVVMGSYSAPAKFAPYLRCWADRDEEKHQRFTRRVQRCGPVARIFVERELRAGAIGVEHVHLRSRTLGAFRFGDLLEDEFSTDPGIDEGKQASLSDFQCRESSVKAKGPTLRSLVCMRAYKKYPGLYDLVLWLATVERFDEALVSTVVAEGVSQKTAKHLTKAFVEGIRWNQ